jgi:hypothetical protein
MSQEPSFQDAADAVATLHKADVLFINAPIYRPLDANVHQVCRRRRRRKNVVLILVTQGGDAGAAYRIARCLQSSYDRFVLFVTGFCKSAGTLLAIGANELIVADSGELGPLDVQMSKPDELLQRQSGLTATAALSTLHQQAFQAFEHFFLGLVTKSGNAISTRTATQIAVQLTGELFKNVYGHVDPMHVGEAGRALKVAEQYGDLLRASSGNLEDDALSVLTQGFASHDFVIDRKQIKALFKNVRAPNTTEQALIDMLGSATLEAQKAGERPFMAYLSSEEPQPHEQILPGVGDGDQDDETAGAHDTSSAAGSAKGGPATAGDAEPAAEGNLSAVRSIRSATSR